MKNTFVLSTALLLGSVSMSYADDMLFSCTRYQSKCTGNSCDAMAAGIRQDTEKKILKFSNVEVLEYRVNPESASENMIKGDADVLASRKYQVYYKSVAISPSLVTMANKSAEGMDRERISIETGSGFYSYYVIHTDGSLQNIPVGQPYKAYFGWCENLTPPEQTTRPETSFLPTPAR